MRYLVLILAVLALACTTASYDPESGEVKARALGQSKATVTAGEVVVVVEGGALSDGFIGPFNTLASAIGRLFGGGGEAPTIVVNVPEPTTE